MTAGEMSDVLVDVPVWAVVLGASIGLGVVALHVWLSSRNPVWLGGLVPALWVAADLVGFVNADPTLDVVIVTSLPVFGALAIWWAGQDQRAARRSGEEPPPQRFRVVSNVVLPLFGSIACLFVFERTGRNPFTPDMLVLLVVYVSVSIGVDRLHERWIARHG